MTTSGVTTYAPTADDVIKQAMHIMEALEEDEPVTAEHTRAGLRGLNNLMQSWQADGGHRWCKTDAVLPLTGKARYVFNRDFTGDAAYRGSITGVGSIAPPASPAPLAPSISIELNDVLGTPVVGNQIIIPLQGGSHAIRTITGVGTSFGLLTPTPGQSFIQVDQGFLLGEVDINQQAAFGPYIDGLVTRPMAMSNIRRATRVNGTQVPVEQVGRADYMNQTNKQTVSQVIKAYYVPALDRGELYVWPIGRTGSFLHFNYERPIETVTDSAETLDYPPEWTDALAYNLALRLSREYAVPTRKRQEIGQLASELYERCKAWDQDQGSVKIGLSWRR